MRAVICPELFIWDCTSIKSTIARYSDIADLIMDAFDTIEQYDIPVVFPSDYALSILSHFPYEDIYACNGEFVDFAKSVQSFLSKHGGDEDYFIINTSKKYHTPTINKPHFNTNINNSIDELLNYSYERDDRLVFIYTEENSVDLKISTNPAFTPAKTKEHDLVSIKNFENFTFKIYGRAYEENIKHNAISGWSSPLPKELNNSDLQDLLEIAINTREGSTDLVAKSNICNQYIRFRKHGPNTYHAYPESKVVFEKIKGLALDDIPAI